jgi:hypothetical protein
MSGFYWKLGRLAHEGAPYMPPGLAVEQLVKYGALGAQLRYVSGPGDGDPTGFELFVPYGMRPEEQRKRLLEMSCPAQWERVHLWDPEPRSGGQGQGA